MQPSTPRLARLRFLEQRDVDASWQLSFRGASLAQSFNEGSPGFGFWPGSMEGSMRKVKVKGFGGSSGSSWAPQGS